ncbi:hypothetical protein [Rhizobium freirei]|nr:hypothetical protein [Rhizobium freirei]
MPRSVVFAGELRILNPLHAANGNDMAALVYEGDGLARVCPVSVEEQPSWRDLLEAKYHRVEDFSCPRGILNYSIGLNVIDIQRVKLKDIGTQRGYVTHADAFESVLD